MRCSGPPWRCAGEEVPASLLLLWHMGTCGDVMLSLGEWVLLVRGHRW